MAAEWNTLRPPPAPAPYLLGAVMDTDPVVPRRKYHKVVLVKAYRNYR